MRPRSRYKSGRRNACEPLQLSFPPSLSLSSFYAGNKKIYIDDAPPDRYINKRAITYLRTGVCVCICISFLSDCTRCRESHVHTCAYVYMSCVYVCGRVRVCDCDKQWYRIPNTSSLARCTPERKVSFSPPPLLLRAPSIRSDLYISSRPGTHLPPK